MLIGFTKAYRKELVSDIWGMPPLYQRVFFYLRQSAVWKSELFPTRQNYKIALNPGQLITSFSIIAEGVSWYEYGVKKTPNKKTIKDILEWLECNSMVTVFSNRYGTFVIIRNWDSYNENNNIKGTPNNQQKVTLKKRQPDTLKEGKEGKEVKKKTFTSDSIEYRLANYFYKYILKNNPEFKEPNIQTWASQIDFMIRIDNRDPEKIKSMIKWCQEDTPDKQKNGDWKGWSGVILSVNKLRKQFDQLWLKMNQAKGNGNSYLPSPVVLTDEKLKELNA